MPAEVGKGPPSQDNPAGGPYASIGWWKMDIGAGGGDGFWDGEPEDTGSKLVPRMQSPERAAPIQIGAGRSSAWPTVQVRFSLGTLRGSQKGTKGRIVTPVPGRLYRYSCRAPVRVLWRSALRQARKAVRCKGDSS